MITRTVALEYLAQRFSDGAHLSDEELERLYHNGKHLLSVGTYERLQVAVAIRGLTGRKRVVSR